MAFKSIPVLTWAALHLGYVLHKSRPRRCEAMDETAFHYYAVFKLTRYSLAPRAWHSPWSIFIHLLRRYQYQQCGALFCEGLAL
jgi:hypothetical protein